MSQTKAQLIAGSSTQSISASNVVLSGATSGTVTIAAPAAAGSNTLTLPTGNGTAGQFLQTNGSGALSFATVTTGKILQVVQATKTDTFSDTSSPANTDWVDVTGLSVSITPQNSSNKILVIAQVSVVAAGAQVASARLVRGSTAIHIGDASSNRTRASVSLRQESGQSLAAVPIIYLDSPATTSSTTYKIQVVSEGTVYVNRSGSDSDSSGFFRTSSSIIAMEVAA